MQSQQEKLISILIENSMGGSFVFAPDNYYKGGKLHRSKEPADIVWACNNCIILMAMTETSSSSEKMFDHNMKQLKGWMRFWKAGSRLTGRNAAANFDIGFSDYRFKILLSIVHGQNSSAEYHPRLTNELNSQGYEVRACATIPQDVIGYIARHNGSTIDLLKFIESLKKINEPLTLDNALKLISKQHTEAFFAANPAAIVPDYETDTDLAYLIRQFRLLRNNKGTGLDELQAIINDLSWTQITKFLYTVHYVKKRILAVPLGHYGDRHGIGKFLFPPYNFMFSVYSMGNSDFNLVSKKYINQQTQWAKEFPEYKAISLDYMILDLEGNFTMHAAYMLTPVTSATENLLELWND